MATKRSSVLVSALLALMMLVIAGCGPNLFERLDSFWTYGCCGILIIVLDIIALVELAGSARPLSNKILWALLIIFAPVLGCVLYYLFGR